MKKILLLCGCLLLFQFLPAQTTITIGTGTDSQPYPFNLWGGYARSAAIYTSGEIGSSGFITSLGWDVVTPDLESCPVKIYLKLISDGSLYSIAWDDLVSGATLVFDAPASFTHPGWKTIDVAGFSYSNANGQNLLVLCEANYGGNGAPTYPLFAYSFNPDMHERWQQYETPPIDPGLTDEQRPNIRITYDPLMYPNPPSGFIGHAVSASQVDLSWKKNASNNNVMVAFNTVNSFGTPGGNYLPGNSIAGGGTVLYNGAASNYSHNTGLDPATTYYYRAWSVVPPAPVYSGGTGSSATTLCVAQAGFPCTTDFETAIFPPLCWSIAQKPWTGGSSVSAFGVGTGSAFANIFNSSVPSGAFFDLISPDLDMTALSNPVVAFDHAYATYSGEVDVLELWVSYDFGETWSLLNTWPGGADGALNTGGLVPNISFVPTANQWASKNYALPAATTKIRFRAVSALGNNLYLDNIVIGDQAILWNGIVSAQWNDPLNWTPHAVPTSFQDVIIQASCPNYPVISTADPVCKNLLIKAGASVTVSSGSVLTITGDATLEAGSVTPITP